MVTKQQFETLSQRGHNLWSFYYETDPGCKEYKLKQEIQKLNAHIQYGGGQDVKSYEETLAQIELLEEEVKKLSNEGAKNPERTHTTILADDFETFYKKKRGVK